MTSSQRPRKKMVSRCTPETERGTLVFDIAGYSLLKGFGSKFIRSASFPVGGYQWCIRYYPNGDSEDNSFGYISVYLELMSKITGTGVMARFDLRLLNQTTKDSTVFTNQVKPRLFESVKSWGTQKFKKISELEASQYLQDDRIVIECDITVILGTPVCATEAVCEIQVSPSDLSEDLGKLLETKKRTDVTFKVEREVFHAHKLVLAMRSPVFEAELCGPMADKQGQSITIEDMQPAVFKALLHFIYTDSLPARDDLDEDENEEMVKHLLVAADRYAMERMKLICESILCKRLQVESVATTLALADQHNCNKLKDACIGFISSPENKNDVMASKGYEHLKRACPTVFMDIWEKAAKSQKI